MSVKETIASYDRIAGTYAQRWQDRTVMLPALKRFVARVRERGLVLDVGCGPGFDGKMLRDYGLRVLGLDLSAGMLQSGRLLYPGDFVQADMRRLPLRTGVDGIWCNASLLHLSRRDAARALRQFWRVMAPGGVLYVAVKEGTGEIQRSDAYGSDTPRYFTYWQSDDLDTAIRLAGFELLERWKDSPPEQAWLGRLARKA